MIKGKEVKFISKRINYIASFFNSCSKQFWHRQCYEIECIVCDNYEIYWMNNLMMCGKCAKSLSFLINIIKYTFKSFDYIILAVTVKKKIGKKK